MPPAQTQSADEPSSPVSADMNASMSTLSGLVLTSSSTITLDLLKGNIVKQMSEKKQLVIIRIFIAIFVVISAGIAIYQYNSASTFIAQLMGISWGALAGAFLAPFMYGLYSKRITVASVWTSFAIGVGLTVSNMFIGYILGMDTFALGLMKAAELIEDGRIDEFVKERYSSYYNTEIGKKILSGETTLQELSAYAESKGSAKLPGSGKQEMLESIVNSVLFN